MLTVSIRRLALAVACLALATVAAVRPAAAATSCSAATSKGSAPSDYADYCWLDFSGYSDALARASGQPFSFALPDGSTLNLTLQVTTNKVSPALTAHAVPSWSGAAFGNSAFGGIAGKPVLYEAQSNSTVNIVLSAITVLAPLGSGASASYAIIAADGESTNGNESLSFTTNGQAWAQTAQIPNGSNYPSVSGVGTATVTETGIDGTVGSFAFASFNNPTTISATLVGGGLQGALFAVRYASIASNVQLSGARANAVDQFTYRVQTTGGQVIATNTSNGSALGPFVVAQSPTIAASYPFVVTELLAPGSVSTLANYAVSLTCTNQNTGASSTPLPTNQAVTSYTFPSLQYADAISCLFTNTANRAALSVAKSGPAQVNAAGSLSYTVAASNSGPLSANGALVSDAAVANFSALSVACTASSGGAACPAAGALTIASLQGAGIAIPTLPNGGSVSLVVSGTAGSGNISNTAAIAAPAGVTNSNLTPTSTANTTVTAVADVSSTLAFPASVNAGQAVSGTVTYGNSGPSVASGLSLGLMLPAGLSAPPTITGLPNGVTYSYAANTGVVTFAGMPGTLAAAASIGPLTVGYTQPPSGSSTVSATAATTTTDSNSANNNASVTIGGAAVADLASALNFPASINAGQAVSGTVTYTDNGPSTAAGTTFQLTLPANLAASPTVSGLPAGAGFSYAANTGVVTFTAMPTTLGAGNSVGALTVGYLQPAAGTSTVSVADTTTTSDPNLGNNAATTTIAGSPIADVSSALNFPASVNAGQPVSGALVFANNGPSVASGLTFSLTLPANLAVAPTLSGLPNGATYSYAAGSGIVTLSGMPASLAAGATLSPITVLYAQPGSATSTVTAAISASTTDSNPANNSANGVIAGSAVADVAASASFPGSVLAGQPVSGSVTFTNNGPSAANAVNFSLSAPANLAMPPSLSGLPNGATYSYAASTGVITLNGMPTTLAAGAAIGPLSVGYAQPASGTSMVSAAVHASTTDPNAGNNTVALTIGGSAVADLMAGVAFPASVAAGQPVSGSVTFTNNGPSTAGSTTFTLVVPANLAAAPTVSGLPLGAGASYTPSSGVVTLTAMPATLAAGAALAPINVGYVQPASAASSVTAAVHSATTDSNAANNTAIANIGGSAVADVAVTALFPANVNAGQTVSGTVTFTNKGPSIASGTTFTLNVPANLAAAPILSGLPNGATYGYNQSSGAVTLAGMPATLAANAGVGAITLTYPQPANGTSVINAAVQTTTADPNPSNNSIALTIGGAAVADVATILAFPPSVDAGQAVSGTVTFGNHGPSSAAGTAFTLSVPPGLKAAPALSGLQSGVSFSYAAGSGLITFTGLPGTLLAGSSVGPFSVHYLQPTTGSSMLSASVTTSTLDPNLSNNSASVSIAGSALADASTTLAFPAHVDAGQPVSGTVTFVNQGPSTAAGTMFALTLPPNLSQAPVLSGLPSGVTYHYVAATGVTTLLGLPSTLAAASGIAAFNVTFIQPASANSTVSAGVTTSTADPNLGNDSATATIGGAAVADTAASLTFPASVNAGQAVSGTVSFVNQGPSTATAVSVTLNLPANLAVAPTFSGLPNGASANYSSSSGVVQLIGFPPSLAAAASFGPVTVSYTQPVSGNSTVTATVQATTADPQPSNNRASAVIAGAASQIAGAVFNDLNRNQIFDTGDLGLSGITVQLFSGSRVIATALSDTAGRYAFTGIAAGAYSVAVTAPLGYLGDTPVSVLVTVNSSGATLVNFGELASTALGSLILSKSTSLVNISAGQSVPYTIIAANPASTPVSNVTVVDFMPAGFKFRAGSGSVGGQKLDPSPRARELLWSQQNFAAGEKKIFSLVLSAGAGVGGGEYVNQATALSGLTNTPLSNTASASVRVVGDPSFDCPELLGKVFDDANANGIEDAGEKGIAGVRLVTVHGLLVTTDSKGRYHIVCPAAPEAGIGSNFIVKVDERTLPSGYRLTTDNPETVRLTAGKVSKLNFGASEHRRVRIEISDASFATDTLRADALQRLEAFVTSIKDEATIVRVVYFAAHEAEATVTQRLAMLQNKLAALCLTKGCRFPLRTEEDIVRDVRP